MATREEKLAAVEAALKLPGTFAERLLAVFEAMAKMEPPPAMEATVALLVGPPTPAHAERLKKLQGEQRALLVEMLATS